MATSFYDVGSVTLTNGSAVVTGVGTLWQTALITNGFVAVEAPGNLLPILTVDSDSQITAEQEWVGLTGTYSYGILRQTDQMQDNAENSRALAYVISEIRNGTLFKYDAAGTLADRALYNERPKGFSYLVFAGTSAQLYVKASATSGDWAGPFAYGTGPTGPMGPAGFTNFRGTYAAGTTYLRNDGVYHNGSSWVALQTTTGNAPPNLPTTSNAFWSLLASKGTDGTGIGDMLASVYDPQNRQEDIFAAIDRPHLGHLVGLTLANDTTSPNTHIIIAAGEAADDTGVRLLKLAAGLRKNLSAAWTAGAGGGGRDTSGALAANSWYHVFLIGNPTSGAVDVLASGSISNPAMPSGYTLKRRLCSVLTDGSGALVPILQTGDFFAFKTPINNISSVDNGGAVSRLRTVSVPLGMKVEAELGLAYAGTQSGFSAIADPDQGAISVVNCVGYHVAPNAGATFVRCFTDVNGRVASLDSASTAAGGTLSIWTRGYFDRRGRL